MKETTLSFILYGAPCLLLYVFFLKVVLQMKSLSVIFKVLFIISFVVNMVAYANSWISLRLRGEDGASSYYFWMKNGNSPFSSTMRDVHYFLFNYFYYAQNACVVLGSFNVLSTALTNKYKASRVWKNNYLLIILLTHGVALVIAFATRFPVGSTLEYDAVNGVFLFSSRLNAARSSLTASIVGLLMIIGCGTMSFVSRLRLSRIKSRGSRRKELSFLKFSFYIFFAQSLNILLVILTLISSMLGQPSINSTLLVIAPYILDVFTISPGVFLVLVPGPIRRAAWNSFFGGSSGISKDPPTSELSTNDITTVH